MWQWPGTGLTNTYGVGPVVADLLIGYTGNMTRFATRHHYTPTTGPQPSKPHRWEKTASARPERPSESGNSKERAYKDAIHLTFEEHWGVHAAILTVLGLN